MARELTRRKAKTRIADPTKPVRWLNSSCEILILMVILLKEKIRESNDLTC